MAIEDISEGETKYSTVSDFATYVSSNLAAASGGWDAVADTWTYLGTGTVSIPAGGTLLYNKGDKIKFEQGGTQLYFYAIEVGGTTLKLTGGSDYTLGTAAISNIYYSKIANPLDFPDWFNFTFTPTGFSSAPANYTNIFSIKGKLCTFIHYDGGGASNTTGFTIALPVTAAAVTGALASQFSSGVYNNGAFAASGTGEIASGGTVVVLYTTARAAWTASGNKGTGFVCEYPI